MILELKRQGLGVSAIARQTGLDRKTVRKYLERGLEAPIYGPREPGERLASRFGSYLTERLSAFPGLSARRLHREIKAMGLWKPSDECRLTGLWNPSMYLATAFSA